MGTHLLALPQHPPGTGQHHRQHETRHELRRAPHPLAAPDPMSIKRPCIVCGTLTDQQTRCEQHRLAADNQRYRRRGPRAHYAGDYRARAARVRANATECWICGQGPRPGDPWTADHVLPGDPESPLAPAHRSCNSRRGNRG